jgi:hypothetical protein
MSQGEIVAGRGLTALGRPLLVWAAALLVVTLLVHPVM